MKETEGETYFGHKIAAITNSYFYPIGGDFQGERLIKNKDMIPFNIAPSFVC
jgi:hypothetical protein